MKKIPFYRCLGCGRVAAPWDIEKHGCCPKCVGARFRPTNLTIFEEAWQLLRIVWRRLWTR